MENVPDCVTERDIYSALRTVGKISSLQWEEHGGGEFVQFAFDDTKAPQALLQRREKLGFNVVVQGEDGKTVMVGPLSAECNVSEVCTVLAGFGNLVRMTKIPPAMTTTTTTTMRSCVLVFDDVNAAKRVCKFGLVVNGQHLTLNLV